MVRTPGSKQKIRNFLSAHVGEVVESQDIREASGNAVEWGRRLRELRAAGWKILSHNDTTSLKPGQYLMTEVPRNEIMFEPGISARRRAAVLDRNGFTCQMCGATPGEVDPNTGRKVRLHIGHIVDKSLGGNDELSNLRALCSSCNQGAKNITAQKPSTIWLLSQVRRAGQEEQRALYEWLRLKLGS
jgi:hypothetical protein